MPEHDQLFKLTQQIGECVGRMDSFCEGQQKINEKLDETITKLDTKFDSDQEKQNARISSLEGSRTKIYGVAIGSGLTSGGIVAWLSKVLGVGGGHG